MLKLAGIGHRAPKECRDTSATHALMADANPMRVAAQHGHSVQVMMRDYAKWIPSADRGANQAAVNSALGLPASTSTSTSTSKRAILDCSWTSASSTEARNRHRGQP